MILTAFCQYPINAPRADRLFDILQTLRAARHPLTAAAIAEKLEVTGPHDLSRHRHEGALGLGYTLRRGLICRRSPEAILGLGRRQSEHHGLCFSSFKSILCEFTRSSEPPLQMRWDDWRRDSNDQL